MMHTKSPQPTFLHHLARHGRVQDLWKSLDNRIDIDIDARGGYMLSTALYDAVRCDNFNAAQVLLAMGANPNRSNRYNTTPLHIVTLTKNEDMAILLLANGAGVNVENGEDVTIENDLICKPGAMHRGGTALQHACRSESLDIVNVLIDFGSDVFIKTADGWTTLMLASAVGCQATVRVLIKRGVDPRAMSVDGRTAMDIARHQGHDAVEVTLVDEVERTEGSSRDSGSFTHIRDGSFTHTMPPSNIPSRNDVYTPWRPERPLRRDRPCRRIEMILNKLHSCHQPQFSEM